MHELVPGKRFDRYYELGKHVLGPKKGFWLVMPQQLTVQVASTIVYCVTGGKSLKKFFDMLVPVMTTVRETYYILFFVCLQLLLSQTPNFNKLKAVSSLAAVMSVWYVQFLLHAMYIYIYTNPMLKRMCVNDSYSMVAFVMSIVEGAHHHPAHYGVRSHTATGKTFDAFNALGTIAFAFAGHSVVSEIQATLPSTLNKPSKVPMWRGVTVAYSIVIACYLSVAVSGFWAFGNRVDDDILVTLEHPNWLIAIANFMVFVHVLGSFQVPKSIKSNQLILSLSLNICYNLKLTLFSFLSIKVFAMPVFDTMETYLVQKLNFSPSKTLRFVCRSAFVCKSVVGLIGMCIPFFGGLLGFFGGLAFTSTSYIIPCVLWLEAKKPQRWSFHWIASWTCITVGVIIALVAPIGGIRTIIVSAKTYKLFT
ncbi:Lysine histidine transporter-like 5, partial [Mucuna pruriens]